MSKFACNAIAVKTYMRKTFQLSLLLLVMLCAMQLHAQQKYGKVTYNKKNVSELITGRNPEFGITGRDGCVVFPALYLELKDVDAQQIKGWVREEKQDKPYRESVLF